MFSGLQFLHSNYIMHRDLKPENLMLSRDGNLKFIDFGMSKQFGETVKFSQNTMTLLYRPPEILFGSRYYGPSADMWSAGCIFAEIMMKKPLFPGFSEQDQL
jgi:cyclin-dependent kinase 7